MSLITVKSKSERFRRAGIDFSRAGVEIETDDLTPQQTLALVSEPALTFFADGRALDRPSEEQLAEMRQEIADQIAAVATGDENEDGKDPEANKPASAPAKKPASATAKKSGGKKPAAGA